jgi:hypothetical protein
MQESTKILGCFISCPTVQAEGGFVPVRKQEQADKECAEFRQLIWGETGLFTQLGKLTPENYGKDLNLVLFKFILKPLPFEISKYKRIENYSTKNKDLAINIFVNDENFFQFPIEGRIDSITQFVSEGLEEVSQHLTKRKLDTDFQKLKQDVAHILQG